MVKFHSHLFYMLSLACRIKRTMSSSLLACLWILQTTACAPQKRPARKDDAKLCALQETYEWVDGHCYQKNSLGSRQAHCQSSGGRWVNEKCMSRQLASDLETACGEQGRAWVLDELTGSETCLSKAETQTRREFCKEQDGNVWEEGRCLNLNAKACLAGGDVWTSAQKCLTPEEHSCLEQIDGAVWVAGQCVSQDEKNCLSSTHTKVWRDSTCHTKNFVDYCQDPSRVGTQEIIHRFNPDPETEINALQEAIKTTQALMEMLRKNSGKEDLDCTTAMEQLRRYKSLTLNEKNLRNLAPIAHLDRLEKLYLSKNQITDLDPLKALSELTTLNLFENRVTDLSPLTHLSKLEKLILTTNQVVSVRPLAALGQLKTLNLRDNKLTSIKELFDRELSLKSGGLSKLEALDLSRNCSLSNVSDLSKLAKLKDLNLKDTQVDIEALDPSLKEKVTANSNPQCSGS